MNYTEKVDKIRNILSCWEYRRLTLIGKIQVIKSLLLSQLTYILTPLATNQNFINEINDIFYRFLWNNKGDKTKRTVLINKYENGGLKMVDLSSLNKSLKTTWIRKYLDTSNQGKWKEIVFLELEKHGGSLIFKGNFNKIDSLKTFSVKNKFTKKMLEIWSEVNFEGVIKTKQQFLVQPLWHNSLIRIIDNKPIIGLLSEKLFLRGISNVKDLMKEPCKFLCLKDFIELYKIQINPLKYCGLISALKCLYNKNFPNESTTVSVKPDSFLNSFLKSSKGNKIVYKKLVSLKSYVPEKSQLKWNTDVSQEGCKADWKAAYTLASKGTKTSTLINFQYRFLHRTLPTIFFLTKLESNKTHNALFAVKLLKILFTFSGIIVQPLVVLARFPGKSRTQQSRAPDLEN